MRVDVLVSFDIDTEKGTVKLAKQQIVNQEGVIKKASKSKKDSSEIPNDYPVVILESNKLVLNEKAMETLGAAADDRIDIKYSKIQGKECPVIGRDEIFGTKGGNKLTQKGTISYRGNSNNRLAKFGSEFKLIETEKEGIFELISTSETSVVNTEGEEIVLDQASDEDNLIQEFQDNLLDQDESLEITSDDFTITL